VVVVDVPALVNAQTVYISVARSNSVGSLSRTTKALKPMTSTPLLRIIRARERSGVGPILQCALSARPFIFRDVPCLALDMGDGLLCKPVLVHVPDAFVLGPRLLLCLAFHHDSSCDSNRRLLSLR
jgi:hypothetical protein